MKPISLVRTSALVAVSTLLFGSAGLIAQASPSAASAAIHYTISMPQPALHLYDISIDLTPNRDSVTKLQMPVWSPGRYARMDFAKNVQEFSVTSTDGKPVRWDRENGSLWRIYPAGAARVIAHYKVFANDLDGTFSVLDTLHANWNGPSLFMYVEGRKPDAVTLHIQQPAGWHIINGDAAVNDQQDYTFENYDRLVDTPTEVAPSFMVDSVNVDGRLYRIVVHHNGPVAPAVRARFVDAVKRIVTSHNRVVAPPPLRMYTFLFHVGFPGGDGMEHLYSTQIINPNPWTDSASILPVVNVAAHEYFHTWNVKRIRPFALGPFDYTHEQYQPSLWVAEGWTQYYGEMTATRAQIAPGTVYGLVGAIIQANLTAPGRKEVSARMSSFEAPFLDAAPRAQKTNSSQTFFSYYTKGAGIALALDLMIREHTNGARSLDDALRTLKRLSWDLPNQSYYLQGRGYTEAEVEQAVSEAMGTNVHEWFEQHVGGKEDIDYDELLSPVGLKLDRSAAQWTLTEMAGATPAQIALRKGWLLDSR